MIVMAAEIVEDICCHSEEHAMTDEYSSKIK